MLILDTYLASNQTSTSSTVTPNRSTTAKPTPELLFNKRNNLNQTSTSSTPNRSTTPATAKPTLELLSKKRTKVKLLNNADSDNNLDHQMLTDLVELVDALDARKELNGLILISKGEEFKHDEKVPEWENLTQIHLDHIPGKLELQGNTIRTLSIIIIDAHMSLLRGLSTASSNFFEALQPTVAILIVLPHCHQQIRDNLSAFTLLRLWRQHGLYKLIVVCHRRYYTRQWTSSMKPRDAMKLRDPPMKTREQSMVREDPTPPEDHVLLTSSKQPMTSAEQPKEWADQLKTSVIQENSFQSMKESMEDEKQQKNVRLQENNTDHGSKEEMNHDKQTQNTDDQRIHDADQSPRQGKLNEFSELLNEISTNKLFTFDEEVVTAYNKTMEGTSVENDTQSTPNDQTRRRPRTPTSCKFLVWLFHPFKTCMMDRFDNETLESLQQYLATIDPNLDALTGNGEPYLEYQPHLQPKLTFSANFQSFGTSDSEERDARCRKIKHVRGHNIRHLGEVFKTLEDRPHNMHACQFYVSIYHRIPTAVIRSDPTRVEGLDGQILHMLASRMNFTPNLLVRKERLIYGMGGVDQGPGTFVDILNRNVDMNFNGHFVKGYSERRLAFTRFITHDIVCLLAPKAPQVSPLDTVLLSFHWPVWCALCLTFAVLLTIYYVWWNVLRDRFIWKPARPLSSYTGSRILLELYRTMLNLPSSGIAVLSADYRLLLAVLYVFSFIVTNAFQGSLFTFISTPVYYPDLNTFADLAKVDLPLRTSSYGWDDLFIEDEHLEHLGKRLEHWNESALRTDPSHFVQFQRINTHWRHVFHDVRIRPLRTSNLTRTLHVMNERLITYFIAYVLLTDSPYRTRIDQLLSYMDQAGLVQKWMLTSDRTVLSRFTPIRRPTVKTTTSATFALDDLRAPFSLLLGGLVLSGVVLGLELALHQWGRCKARAGCLEIGRVRQSDRRRAKRPDRVESERRRAKRNDGVEMARWRSRRIMGLRNVTVQPVDVRESS